MNKTMFVACLGTLSTLVQPADAQFRSWPPTQPSQPAGPCASGTGPILISIGQSIGEDVGYGLWDDFGENCLELDDFIDTVADVSAPGAGGSCLAQGFIDGVNNAVDEVANACIYECLDKGDKLGAVIGKTACGNLGDIVPPPPVYSRIAQASCETTYDRYVADDECYEDDSELLAAFRSLCGPPPGEQPSVSQGRSLLAQLTSGCSTLTDYVSRFRDQ